jgi:hypothetical protein
MNNKINKTERLNIGIENVDYIYDRKIIEINNFSIYDLKFLNKKIETSRNLRYKIYAIIEVNTKGEVAFLVLTRLIGNIITDRAIFTGSNKEMDFKKIKVFLNQFIDRYLDSHFLIIGDKYFS